MRDLADPDMMTPTDRRAKAATILAAGFLRLRLREAKKREIPLDVLPRPSCVRRRRGMDELRNLRVHAHERMQQPWRVAERARARIPLCRCGAAAQLRAGLC